MRSFVAFIAGLLIIVMVVGLGLYAYGLSEDWIEELQLEQTSLEWITAAVIFVLLAMAGFLSGFITASIHQSRFSKSFMPVLVLALVLLIGGYLVGNTGSASIKFYVVLVAAILLVLVLTVFSRWGWSVVHKKLRRSTLRQTPGSNTHLL